ncbi:MAG: spore germination protein [Clostridia bacterium]
MWPFSSRPTPDTATRRSPVIHEELHRGRTVGVHRAAPHPGSHQDVSTTEPTPAHSLQMDKITLKQLMADASSLGERLDALLTDFSLTNGHLDRFGGSVDAAYHRLKSTVAQSPDIIVRRLTIGRTLRWPALLAFADGMVDNVMIDQDILRLLELNDLAPDEFTTPSRLQDRVSEALQAVGHVASEQSWSSLLDKLTYGSALLFVDGVSQVLVLDTVKFGARSIGRPQSEPSIKGPQEAFNEILLTHINQIRRRIRTSWLKFDSFTVGGYTKTTVLVAHIEGLTNPELVSAVEHRIQHLQVDSVQEISQISTRILERASPLFPMTRLSERVDWVVRDMLRGKVAVMIDNDPFVATYPNTFMDFYQTTQDYVFSAWDASLIRLIRLLGIVLAIYLMPTYIALTSVDPDLVPTKLILTLAGARQGIPFPPVVEVLIMYGIIAVLQEAANRLPQPLATTLGTVGAVVVGTAVVKAGLVDTLMIIIATLSALGLFTTPSYEMTAAWRWLFWGLIVGAYALGLFGIVLVSVAIVTYLCSLESFGVPYFSPFGPTRWRDLRDSWIRVPLNRFLNRPVYPRPVDVSQAAPWTFEGGLDLHRAQEDVRP